MKFGVYVTPEIIYAIMQTNIAEAMEFIDNNIASKWLFVILICALVLSYYMYKLEKQHKHNINVITLVLLVLSSFSIALSDKKNLRVVYMLTRTISHYGEELAKFKDVQKRRNSGAIDFTAKKQETGETYIVVIGESLNKNHMSLYGYTRDTTPKLQNKYNSGELLVFNNTYSNHTHTMPTLSLLLTEANQKNNKSYYNSLSIIDILNKAKLETYWITNQVLQSVDDNLVGVIATQANQLYRINHEFGATSKTQNYDGEVIKIIEDILKVKDNNNKVLFVHLMGNHWDYCLRYPVNFNKFSGKLPVNQFGIMANNEELNTPTNCYDNSVLYNDYVVSSLINNLSSKNNVSGLIYVSDHADDVLRMRGHNSGMFTFDMTEIPMLMWFSESYKKKYISKFNNLSKHKNSLFSNDLIYDTLIGIAGVNTLHHEKNNDLSNSDFKFPVKTAYTLHGKVPYNSNKNYNFWISNNIQQLISNNLSNKILPHRVNSTGKLNQVIRNKYRSLELDINFVNNKKGSYFIVGHDTKTQSNIKLENYLKLMPINDMNKIWFDIKGINKNNINDVRKKLNLLDKIYNLKEKVIIESDTTSASFSGISNDGFHTSYYLPGHLAKLYRKNKLKKLKKETTTLIMQIKEQKCDAISFDISLYPYVKEYLEKELDKKIIYHTWDLKMELKNDDFFKIIQKQNYYNDERIKTILVTYQSKFNL